MTRVLGAARLRNAVDIADVRSAARRSLPRLAFDAIDGAAEDEWTAAENRRAFERVTLRPRILQDVGQRNLSTEVWGCDLSFPLIFAPTGAGRLARTDAERVAADCASRAGIVYCLSSVASYSMESVSALAPGRVWYQLYPPPDRSLCGALLDQAQATGCETLIITIDSQMRGNRQRDVRNKFNLPYSPTPKTIFQGAMRPRWAVRFLLGNAKAHAAKTRAHKGGALRLREVEQALLKATWPVTASDLGFIRSRWDGQLVVKGMVRPEDCRQLIDLGVDGLILSNHGGRQLDGLPSALDVLPAVVESADGGLIVLMDGGVRRGSDIVKAVALGARACLIGRPYLYGLGAGGRYGIDRVVEIFRSEFDRALALLGVRSVSELDTSCVTRG